MGNRSGRKLTLKIKMKLRRLAETIFCPAISSTIGLSSCIMYKSAPVTNCIGCPNYGEKA